MTLAEKIGQLNMMTAGYAAHRARGGGQRRGGDPRRAPAASQPVGADAARDMQRMAVENPGSGYRPSGLARASITMILGALDQGSRYHSLGEMQ